MTNARRLGKSPWDPRDSVSPPAESLRASLASSSPICLGKEFLIQKFLLCHKLCDLDKWLHPSEPQFPLLLIRECFVSTYQPSILSNQNRILVWVQHPSPRGLVGFTNQEAQAALCSLWVPRLSAKHLDTHRHTHTCSSRALRGLFIGGWLVSMLLPFPIGTASTVKEDTDA